MGRLSDHYRLIMLLRYFWRYKLFRYVMVGGIGFFVDSGLLTLLLQRGYSVVVSRGFSFTLAVSITWLINRSWTFHSNELMSTHKEYAYYFGFQILGALINLSIFFGLIDLYPNLKRVPVVPLALGASISLAFNYLISKKMIFRE